MQIIKSFLFVFILLSMGASSLFAQERSAKELVDAANKLLRGQSSHSKIVMTIANPKWERTLQIEGWNEGREKSLMRILRPAKERGNGTLKIEKEIWNWLPTVERVIKIPPSMMNSSWMGSDFTYSDVVKADSIVKDYEHKILEKKPSSEGILYTIEALPHADAAVVWGKVLMDVLVFGDEILPVKEEDFSERGEHMRTLNFLEVKTLAGRRIPTHIECIPLKKAGHKTMIRYERFETNIQFPPQFFSLKNLQKPLH